MVNVLLGEITTYMGEPAVFVMVDGKGFSMIYEKLLDELFFITCKTFK